MYGKIATPGNYPLHQPWQNYWQRPEAYSGTPHAFDAYGHQATWLEQSVEPGQGRTNEYENSSYRYRDFDVVEVERNVLSPPPKSLLAKPQYLAADVYGDGPVSLEGADIIRTALPRMTVAPLEIKVNNNQKAAASEDASKTSELDPDGLAGSVDAYARDESPSPAPVQIRRSSTRDKATTQSAIPKSWVLRSNDKRSPPAKRPISASFGTVETRKKSKPTTSKSKGSGKGRTGHFWSAEELKTARDLNNDQKAVAPTDF